MKLRDLPNIISVLRLLAVMPVVYLLLEREFGWALLLFAAAGVSDGVDGFLAKHYGWQSALGGSPCEHSAHGSVAVVAGASQTLMRRPRGRGQQRR